MGIIKRGILGGFSKSVANVVGTSWKGIAVMKSKPLSVANPRSAGQVAQRTKFSGIVAIARAVLSSICIPVWNNFASQMSGYNFFVQRNVATAFAGDGSFIPAGLTISPGTGLVAPSLSAVILENDTDVTIEWGGVVAGSSQMGTDKVFCVAVNSAGLVIGALEPSAPRSALEAFFSISDGLVVGTLVNLYVGFISADGKRTFTSELLQVVVTA